VTPEGEIREIVEGCKGATIGCLDCKKVFHRNLMKVLDPIRARRQSLAKDPEAVREALRLGAERARAVARETLDGAKKLMGLL
jgi:tryptophanyl-tRNA synthetase